MRGIFSAGVLDWLFEHGLTGFDLAIGTSAGACNLASFVAGQHGRNLHCYTEIMTRPQLFSIRRFARGGHYMDLDWLWDRFAAERPLDEEAIRRSPTTLVSVATCYRTGKPIYQEQRENVHEGVKGSCALPLLYRGPVRYRDVAMVDGGVSDPIPAQQAYRRGCKRMLVIRSRAAGAIRTRSAIDLLGAWFLRQQPALARAILEGRQRYAATIAFLEHPPADLQLLQIAPPAPLSTSRTTQDRETLLNDYRLGRQVVSQYLPQIADLLAQPALHCALSSSNPTG